MSASVLLSKVGNTLILTLNRPKGKLHFISIVYFKI